MIFSVLKKRACHFQASSIGIPVFSGVFMFIVVKPSQKIRQEICYMTRVKKIQHNPLFAILFYIAFLMLAGKLGKWDWGLHIYACRYMHISMQYHEINTVIGFPADKIHILQVSSDANLLDKHYFTMPYRGKFCH